MSRWLAVCYASHRKSRECSVGCSTWLESSSREKPGAHLSGRCQECKVGCILSTLKMSKTRQRIVQREDAFCFVGGGLWNVRSTHLLSCVCWVANRICSLLESMGTNVKVPSSTQNEEWGQFRLYLSRVFCCWLKETEDPGLLVTRYIFTPLTRHLLRSSYDQKTKNILCWLQLVIIFKEKKILPIISEAGFSEGIYPTGRNLSTKPYFLFNSLKRNAQPGGVIATLNNAMAMLRAITLRNPLEEEVGPWPYIWFLQQEFSWTQFIGKMIPESTMRKVNKKRVKQIKITFLICWECWSLLLVACFWMT